MPAKAPELIARSRDLRLHSTDAERRLWRALRGRQFEDFKFRRQQPLGAYIVDFCCLEKKLTIELDGGQHAGEAIRARDMTRSRDLAAMGFREIRVWNDDVFRNLPGVLEEVRRGLQD